MTRNHNERHVLLEPLTEANIADVITHSSSGTEAYPLPQDKEQGSDYLGMTEEHVRENIGNIFNAYDGNTIVGGGHITSFSPEPASRGAVVQLGYWTAREERQKGYGKAVTNALEEAALEQFPHLHRLELVIHADNLASRALANSMEYEFLHADPETGRLVFYKIP